MKKWALVLGGSSGMGLATVKKLANEGFYILLVHRDRRSAMEAFLEEIKPFGDKIIAFNFDAINVEKIQENLGGIKSALNGNKIDFMVHSVSRGNLKPLISKGSPSLSDQDLILTLEAMALNVLTWTRLLIAENLFNSTAGIVTLTSAGSTRVWQGYAAVGIAKSALESLSKYLAAECAPIGIRVNTINAGITYTPSLQFIPNHEELMVKAKSINPMGRLTTPTDVANAIYLLTMPEAGWITGSLIHVDGGEHLV